MDQATIAKQITGFYKTAFDNSLNVITKLQEETEKVINHSLEQAPWIPEEGKKFVTDMVTACKKGSNDFIAAANGQYEKFGTCFNLNKNNDSAEANTKGKTAKNN
jgi:hypothetical protein